MYPLAPILKKKTTMTTKWSKTGKIKAIILGFLALPNLLMPIGVQGQQNFLMILMPLFFGSIAIPLIVKFNKAAIGQEITKPTWNDNPLTLKSPITFFHFGAFFFLIIGLSMIIGTGIKFRTLSFLGLTSISFGIGILIGIWVTLKWTKTKI
jgi:hypothetical protein